MTAVGWIGLGKAGLPCALALAVRGGHDVHGYDISDAPGRILAGLMPPPREEGIGELLAAQPCRLVLEDSPAAVVASAGVIFIAVQTPHAPAYGGEAPAPEGPGRDFEYAFLLQAVRDVCGAARAQRRAITLVIVSTVLPGTHQQIRPLLNQYVTLVYSPVFISLGDTIGSFCNPPFALAGTDRPEDADGLAAVMATAQEPGVPVVCCGIETAEAIKVLYNAQISASIVFASMVMEICHGTGADCDDVMGALALGRSHAVPGMPDGGPCRPRDLIALSWLSKRLGLSYDLPGVLADARVAQAAWLASLVKSYADLTGLRVVILGKSYKPGSDLTAGSPALLLADRLNHALPPSVVARSRQWDPLTDGARPAWLTEAPRVYAVATAHPEFAGLQWPPGSVVIDPHGYIPDAPGVTVIRVGRK